MKIAITGKGGVGKTTLAAGLALLFAEDGNRVITIDADPDSNLAATIGFPHPEDIIPIIELKDLIYERTDVKDSSLFFKLNPHVDDIPEKYCCEYKGIKMLVMGGIKKGESGCYCPENAFIRALLRELLFNRDDIVIIDMEAGIEHLSRGTAKGVDCIMIVIEPTKRSIETAIRIEKMARDLKIKNIIFVGNKIKNENDLNLITTELPFEIIGYMKYNENLVDGVDERIMSDIRIIKEKLLNSIQYL